MTDICNTWYFTTRTIVKFYPRRETSLLPHIYTAGVSILTLWLQINNFSTTHTASTYICMLTLIKCTRMGTTPWTWKEIFLLKQIMGSRNKHKNDPDIQSTATCHSCMNTYQGWVLYNGHSASGHSTWQIIPRFYMGNSGSHTVNNLPLIVISHHHLCAIKICTIAELILALPLQACCPHITDTSHLLPDLPISSNITSFSQLQNFTLLSSCSSLHTP